MTTIVQTQGAQDTILCGSLTDEQHRDAVAGIATARVTGSVGCTYNSVKVQRLYTSGGHPSFTASDLWLVSLVLCCYHPLSCSSCAARGGACGTHSTATAGHSVCTGVPA